MSHMCFCNLSSLFSFSLGKLSSIAYLIIAHDPSYQSSSLETFLCFESLGFYSLSSLANRFSCKIQVFIIFFVVVNCKEASQGGPDLILLHLISFPPCSHTVLNAALQASLQPELSPPPFHLSSFSPRGWLSPDFERAMAFGIWLRLSVF